jgi:HAMP domain-containing protein
MLTIPLRQAFLHPSRDRLVRRYFFISVMFIGGGLIVSSFLEIYFRYHESQKQVAILQSEIAAAAVLKVEQFLEQIQNGMKAATINSVVAKDGLSPEYEFELKKLLSLVPSITDVVAIDANGVPRLYVSRLRAGPWKVAEGIYNSSVFQQAKRGVSSFGPVYFKQDTEPYMTSMVPIKRFAGKVIGVLQAEVNLEHIWDIIARIKVGKAGYAYIVTERGDLIAHPDFNLVLRGAKMTQLQQVKAAFSTTREAYQPREMVARNLRGRKVFTSYHLIPGTDWALFIEQPLKEAYEPVYASLLRTSSLLLIGLGVALVASFSVARRVVRPLESLRQGVERIGSGNLAYRIELKTGDEFEAVAEEFNRMATDLQESYTALEDKIAARTQELQARTRELARSVEELKALAEVGQAVSSTLDLQTVLSTIVGHAVHLSGTSGGVIYEYDEAAEGFLLRASYRIEKEVVEVLQALPIRIGEGAATSRAAAIRMPVQVPNILEERELGATRLRPIAARLGYRSVLAVPLLREERIMGALTVWRKETGNFSPEIVNLLQTFATQSALAIQNARLFRETRIRVVRSRPLIATSQNSLPTCPTSYARRSTLSSASRKSWARSYSAS